MAAFTTIAAGTLIIGGAALSANAAAQKSKAAKAMMREGQQGIDNFSWQDIEDTVPIRTEGIEMLREENARYSADAMDALRSGGTRGLASVSEVVGATNSLNQNLRASLEEQYTRRDYAKLNMTEQRQANELAGYGALKNVGMHHKMQANADLANTVSSAGYGLMGIGTTDANGDGVTGFGTGQNKANSDANNLIGMTELPAASGSHISDSAVLYRPGSRLGGQNQWNGYYGGYSVIG